MYVQFTSHFLCLLGRLSTFSLPTNHYIDDKNKEILKPKIPQVALMLIEEHFDRCWIIGAYNWI